MKVSSEKAYSGTNAVKITSPGGGYQPNNLVHSLTGFADLQQSLYGRMMINLSSQNSLGGDFTFIQADGPPRAQSGAPAATSVMYRGRVDGRNDHFMANYETWADTNNDNNNEWNTDCWKHPTINNQPPPQNYLIPKDQWACVQWHFDAQANTLKFWLNKNELSLIQVVNMGDGCKLDQPNADRQNGVWWAPQTFNNIRLGVEQYAPDSRPRTMYIDDIAIDDRMVSCPD